MANSFSRLATVTASTKRNPSVASGKRGPAVENITSLKCLPLDPVDAETRHTLGIEAPVKVLQTFVELSVDVDEGDIFVVGSGEYPVRAVSEWAWGSSVYKRLILLDVKA